MKPTMLNIQEKIRLGTFKSARQANEVKVTIGLGQ